LSEVQVHAKGTQGETDETQEISRRNVFGRHIIRGSKDQPDYNKKGKAREKRQDPERLELAAGRPWAFGLLLDGRAFWHDQNKPDGCANDAQDKHGRVSRLKSIKAAQDTESHEDCPGEAGFEFEAADVFLGVH
jgi:hypothetical protein